MSGTGKTTVLEELRAQGFACFDEPGRAVLNHGSEAAKRLPETFIQGMLDHSLRDYSKADELQLAFYDRGLPDIVAYAHRFKVDPVPSQNAAETHRYESFVFVAPPWNEIFVNDDVRRASFDDYLHFHESILNTYENMSYSIKVLPKATVYERVEFIKAIATGA
jgi:predicted ATPase